MGFHSKRSNQLKSNMQSWILPEGKKEFVVRQAVDMLRELSSDGQAVAAQHWIFARVGGQLGDPLACQEVRCSGMSYRFSMRVWEFRTMFFY